MKGQMKKKAKGGIVIELGRKERTMQVKTDDNDSDTYMHMDT